MITDSRTFSEWGSGAYVELKGLQGHAEAPGDGGVDPEGLLDDAARVLELVQGLHGEVLQVHPALLLQAHQLLPQALHNLRVEAQEHDQGGGRAGRGLVAPEQELRGGLLDGLGGDTRDTP